MMGRGEMYVAKRACFHSIKSIIYESRLCGGESRKKYFIPLRQY